FGWMRIAVGATGSIAIFGVAFATFLSALVPLDTVWVQRSFHLLGQPVEWQFGSRQVVAVGVIVICSAVNCLRVVLGGRIQSAMTLLKLLAIAGVVAGVFFLGKGTTWEHFVAPAGGGQWKGWPAF